MDKKIRWLFVFSFMVFVSFMGILYQQKSSQANTRQGIYTTYSTVKKLDQINSLVLETEAVSRGYLLIKDSVWKKNLRLSHIQLINAIKEVQRLTQNTPGSLQNTETLEQLAWKKIKYQNDFVGSTMPHEALMQKLKGTGEIKQISISIKALLASMKKNEEILLAKKIAKNETDFNTGIYLALFGGIVAFILILAVLFQLNADIFLRKKAEQALIISEAKYRNIIENAGVVMYTADFNGKITFTNNQVNELTGYTSEELEGQHFSVLIDPAWTESVLGFYQHQFRNRIPASTMDFLTRTRSGEEKWVEQSAQLLFQGDRITGFQCMVKDITEQKKIEVELSASEMKRKENEYRLTSILDNTTALIFIKDLEGRYIMVNNRFKEVFMLTDDMVINKTDYDFNPKELADHYKKLDDEVLRSKSPIESEELIKTSSGNRNLLLVKFPLLDDKKNAFGISGIATDITERVQSRLQLETALKNAEEAKQLQEQFLANMSHEIRTPLNGIQGMTNLLTETPLNGEQKEFTLMIRRSLDNLMAIVNDILDFSNIKTGKLTLENISFNIREILDAVKNQFTHQVNNKGLDFEWIIDTEVPSSAMGDPYRLKQVLVNIVGNAIKFTKKGTIKIHLVPKEQTENKICLQFTVQDTGIGISEDKLNTIFQSFAQADMDISRGYGGAGLGLAISKGLILAQGGDISARSRQGEGSVFSFYIPYHKAQTPAALKAEQEKGIKLKGKRFLVVEDNEVNQKLIDFVLKKVGGKVDIASHGKEAIGFFEENREYDLVIMDLQMPVMDGYQTATYIRKTLNLSVPIMALTATALKGDQQKCQEVGMNDFMLKPFDFNDLYRRLEGLLYNENINKKVDIEKNNGTEKLYDLSLLEELDDKESLLDVISLFLENTPGEVKQLSALVQERNWDSLYRLAHKIKGAVAILQSTVIAGLLGSIEANAKEAKDLPRLEKEMAEVDQLFTAMEVRLREEQERIRQELIS